MALFLNVTANDTALSLSINAQTKDEVTSNWLGTQSDIFGGTNAVFTTGALGYYAQLGYLGVDSSFAINAVVGAGAGMITFGVNYLLKEGLPGNPSGVTKTGYLGSNNGVTVDNGFPLLEGQGERFFLRENTDLWGVAGTSIAIRIFELS